MRLTIATPAYGPLHPEAAHSFALTWATLAAMGHEVDWDIEPGDSNQARARNNLFHRALAAKVDALICADADMVFSPDDVEQLLAAREDVITASAPRRRMGCGYVGQPMSERRGDLVEMYRIGFGLTILSRECLSRMTEACDRFYVPLDGTMKGDSVAEIVAMGATDEHRWRACDDLFSERWRALGGRMWMHSSVHIGHVGTHVFR